MLWGLYRSQRDILLAIEKDLESMARTIAEGLEQARSANTRAGSLIALYADVKSRLDAVLEGVLTPEQQAQVDEIFDISKDTADDIDAALNTNVPPPPQE